MTVHGGFGKTVEKRLGPPNPRMEHGLLTSVPEEVGDTDRRGRGLLRIVLLQSLLVYALPRLERGLRVARQIGGGCEGGQLILGQGGPRIDLREEFVGFLPGLAFQRISGPVLQFLRAWSRLCAQSRSPRGLVVESHEPSSRNCRPTVLGPSASAPARAVGSRGLRAWRPAPRSVARGRNR